MGESSKEKKKERSKSRDKDADKKKRRSKDKEEGSKDRKSHRSKSKGGDEERSKSREKSRKSSRSKSSDQVGGDEAKKPTAKPEGDTPAETKPEITPEYMEASDKYRRAQRELRDDYMTSLRAKRSQVMDRLHDVEAKRVEVRSSKHTVEDETRRDFEATMRRLDQVDLVKQQQLQLQIERLRLQVDEIQELCDVIEKPRMAVDDMLEFSNRHLEYQRRCCDVIRKPFDVGVAVDTYFPRDVQDRQQLCEDVDTLKALLEMKNSMLWKAMEQNKELKQKETALTDQIRSVHVHYQEELRKWSGLVERYANEVRRLEAEKSLPQRSLPS